ncbi:MAG TPA: helix-turn-helix transcriptional regulator [Gaiellaceae bacterium]|jgi:transcriptional regulator with XRE-family HTH domain|nr:helix-turn-helix transcriptional regulator [Gaiellaceae bacterium]
MASSTILQEARRRAGLSQRELAERAGTSQSAIARIERGRQIPSLETLQRLLHACGLDLELRIVPHDTHDDSLIAATLAMTPEQRLRNLEELSRFIFEGRRALADA